MELHIYKGFNNKFLEGIKDKPLVSNEIENKIDVLKLDIKIKKQLDAALTLLDDEDVRWLTYEEYSLIKDMVALSINDYNTKVVCFVNNLYPDCYPIPFPLNEDVYFEIKKAEEDGSKENLSDDAKKITAIYSTIYSIDNSYFGSFFNYEYDKESKITIKQYYPVDIKISTEKKSAEISVLINDDIETYIKTLNKIITKKPATVSLKETNSKTSTRISNSLKAYCLKNNIILMDYYEELSPDDTVLIELTNIAKNDLKIPNFTSFRDIRFYKNPDISEEVVNISQAQIIRDIINQAEKAYNLETEDSFRDIFITASTGAGKSVMFQVPAVYLAKKYKKLTIIIEPVIALMEDQKDALIARGYNRVEAFNSNLISQVERENVLKKIKDGYVDLLYLSPETLLSYSLETIIGDREVGLLIVDEAHIVTTWGVGFRPDYWYLGGYINNIRNAVKTYHSLKKKIQHFPICACTATAINGGVDDSVNETMISLYMENPIKYIGYVRRDDIKFDIKVRETSKLGMSEYEEKKSSYLSDFVNNVSLKNEKTVVYFPYATTASDAKNGLKSFAGKMDTSKIGIYTGGSNSDKSIEVQKLEKQEAFEKFRTGKYPVMFATKAFGMGVDVNDIKNVYHYAVTGNLCDYVQEIGRAARKVDMTGVAVADFFRNDLTFMQRLFGMSQIRQYQINKVLAGVYDFYKNRMSRSFLISPESFTYIFASKGTSISEDQAINKLKTCLLMLEKDFYDKYNFKVLISRPQSVFTKAYVVINDDNKDDVLQSKYGSAFKFVCKGRKNKPYYNKYGKEAGLVSDIGDVYSIDLKDVWEKYYPNLSFPQFKFWYFSAKTYHKPDKVDVLKEIQPYIFSRQRVTIQVKNDLILSELKSKLLADLEYVADTIYSTFGKSYFTMQEFASALSKEYGMTKARIIANSIFDLVDPKHVVVKPRVGDDMLTSKYSVSNGTFKTYLQRPVLKSPLLINFTHDDNSEYSEYMNIAPDSDNGVALKLLSIFDYISYEVVGGEQPEIFIRLNDPNKVKNIVNGTIKYSNNYVTTAKEKHDRDVKVLYKFFCDLNDDKERWDYVEKYFLGYDVISNTVTPEEGRIELKKIVDDMKSYSANSTKTWEEALILFDDAYETVIKEFEKKSIPMPTFFHTVLKNNVLSDDPIISWPEKNVLIFGSDVTQLDLDICKSKGWTAFKILDLDVDDLLKEVI